MNIWRQESQVFHEVGWRAYYVFLNHNKRTKIIFYAVFFKKIKVKPKLDKLKDS
ncbi:hypothetical protein [uncultured Gammaproteobacteria bacterium]|nr:hypothetical protein [uncultured Gammaproteobacteria bacterium]